MLKTICVSLQIEEEDELESGDQDEEDDENEDGGKDQGLSIQLESLQRWQTFVP